MANFQRPRLSHLFIGAALITTGVFVAAPHGISAAPIADNRFGIAEAYQSAQGAADTGASWELITVRWDEIQPDGPSDWNPPEEIDAWLPTAINAGREVVIAFVGTPAWATDGRPSVGVPSGLFLASGDPTNTWAAFVKKAVGHYSAQGVNRFVIWKDQNLPASNPQYSWSGSIDEYYQMVKTAYLVAKSANPNVKVHLGGYDSYDPAWLGHFLDVVSDDISAPSNNYYFDVVTVHVDFSPEQVYSLVSNSYYLMDFHDIPLKEVWIDEINARPAIDAVYPEGREFTTFPKVTDEQQAAFIMQAFALAFDAGASRVGVYRLMDDLESDHDEAYGLIREDGTARPAYKAYQLVTRFYSNFVYARRVDEQSFPLIDYTRLTGAQRVTHIAWARTEENATLIIPARTNQALLLDMFGNEWVVKPEDGNYRVVVEGAACDDPVEPCVIGGMPWLLVEENIPDLLEDVPLPVLVEQGGVIPTPDPAAILTATAAARPTNTSTPPPTATNEPTETAVVNTQEAAVVEPMPSATGPSSLPEDQVTSAPQFSLRELFTQQNLPPIVITLGSLIIIGGLLYFFSGKEESSKAGKSKTEQPVEDAGNEE